MGSHQGLAQLVEDEMAGAKSDRCCVKLWGGVGTTALQLGSVHPEVKEKDPDTVLFSISVKLKTIHWAFSPTSCRPNV